MLQYTARITSTDTPRVGGRNLIVKDRFDPEPAETTEDYLYRSLILSRKHKFVTGDWYTLSMDVQVPEDAKGLDEYNIYDWSGNVNKYGLYGKTTIIIHNGRTHITFRWGEAGNELSNKGLLLYRGFDYVEKDCPKYPITTSNITLVKGTIGLESYTPAPEDLDDSISKVNTSLVSLASTLLDPDQGEIHKLTSLLDKHKEDTDKSFAELSDHPLTIDKDGYWQVWNVKDSKYVTTQYQSRGRDGDDGHTPVITLDSQFRLLADGELLSQQSLKGIDRINKNLVYEAHKMTTNRDYKTRIVQLDKTHEFEVEADYIISFYSNRMPSSPNHLYFFNSNHNTQFYAKYLDRDKDGRTYYRLTWRTQYPGQTIVADNTCINIFNADNRGDTPYDFSIWDIKLEQGDTPTAYIPHPKDLTPVITLDEQYHLLADGELVSMQSLKGRDGDDGHTPEIHVGSDDYLYIDGVRQRYLRGRKGDPGTSPTPESVLGTPSFRQLLGGEVSEQVQPVAQYFGERYDDLNNRSLTADQRDDVAYLTNSLQVLRSAGNNTLEGLALQRLIALSGNGTDISAYLASNALGAVLKAGITGFGTPQEKEQVAICHNGTGHIGNLYFTGNQIDFRTDEHTNPYLSIGAEEATFIETYLKQARQDDTPVTVSTINLTPTSTGYQRTITTNNDGTRLTITLDKLNVATFDNTLTRLTLDGETLAEWRGTLAFREEYRNGILTPVPVYKPYEATGLTYERVVRAGTHTLRLQIINPQSPYTATINGLKVRRRYDTGAQQSLLTKSGLRLFGSPDRYLDVDYRQRYTPNGGQYTVVNSYLLRIKGGAKIDKLTVDKIEGAGSKLSPIVTPQLGLGGQTTLYPKYDEWVLTSDTKEQQVSFAGLTAEIGKSIYIQTRKRAYLLANGHSFFGLPSVSDNQWLSSNTTYRFLRADATTWLVTSSASPYPWT